MAKSKKPSNWSSSDSMWRDPATVGKKKGGCLGLAAVAVLAAPAASAAVKLFA